MNPSVTLCRTQEAFHRARAEAATLTNVRGLALSSAAAWAKEGDDAEKRDRRHEAAKAHAAQLVSQKSFARLDAELSENPDRGTTSKPITGLQL